MKLLILSFNDCIKITISKLITVCLRIWLHLEYSIYKAFLNVLRDYKYL